MSSLVVTSVKLDPDLSAKIDRVCRKRAYTRTTLIDIAVRRYIQALERLEETEITEMELAELRALVQRKEGKVSQSA